GRRGAAAACVGERARERAGVRARAALSPGPVAREQRSRGARGGQQGRIHARHARRARDALATARAERLPRERGHGRARLHLSSVKPAYIPNLLCIARMLLVPPLVWLIARGEYRAAPPPFIGGVGRR